MKDIFNKTYKLIMENYYDEQQAIKDRAYNKYIHTDFRDPQETNPVEEYQEWMIEQTIDYLKDDSKAQEINDQLDYNFSQEEWDALSPEEKTKEVIKVIIDKAGADPYEIMDTYRLDYDEATGLDSKEMFDGWCEDLKNFANGEFNFFKQQEQQPKEQIDECGGGAPAPGGPAGGPGPGPGPGGIPPPPPPNPSSAANPPNPVPPPHPPRAGIRHHVIRPLLIPAIPYGIYTRKKKKKKVKRRKKK